MTATHYTSSKGEKKPIAELPFPYLQNALKKAIASEERKHTHDANYDNPEREAEIQAMTAEIAKRDEAFKAQQEADGSA